VTTPRICWPSTPPGNAGGGGKRGRREFSVGWACGDREIDAIDRIPKQAWSAGMDQDGAIVPDTYVAEVTGLLDLSA
jgi:hypothetical protein